MTTEIPQTDRLLDEATAFWRSESGRPAPAEAVDAFLEDANRLASEHHARDWRREPMITRATTRLPSELVGFRLFDGDTGRHLGAHLRTDPAHFRPDGHSVISVLSMRNVLANILAKQGAGSSEEEQSRFARRPSEFEGILDIDVFGGVARPR